MKDKSSKKKHESIIGKIIYGFLLFMPLLAIGITCGYAIFNKNAYQSYYGQTINDFEYIDNNLSNIDNNELLYLNTQNYSFDLNYSQFNLYTNNFEIVDNGNLSSTKIQQFNSYEAIRIYCRDTSPEFYGINNDNTYTWIDNNSYFVCKFNITNYSNTPHILSGFYTIQYNKNSFVSEVFYYSVDRVKESPMFSWAKETAIYTGVSSTTALLGITTTFVPFILTYWFIITIIYIIYDIALIMLMIAHKKVHELEESI